VRAVVQRVSKASVSVDGQTVGEIAAGLLVLLGVADGDGPADVEYVASKISGLRVFRDAQGRMNRSVAETGGAVLVVTQYTRLGDVRRGRRPAFDGAALPAAARDAYVAVVDRLRGTGLSVETGEFQADMQVALVNDGPVTILIDSRRTF
jgi:D-tyrosyl-tRNA(Tyr) deacylase